MDPRNRRRLGTVEEGNHRSTQLSTFDPKRDFYVTSDAYNTGLGATLWQKESDVFRPVALASRFLTDCERKYAINELELLGALWGLESFRYYVYGKKVNLLTD